MSRGLGDVYKRQVGCVWIMVINNFTIIGEGLGDGDIATNTSSMSINITHPKDSFNKLQKA